MDHRRSSSDPAHQPLPIRRTRGHPWPPGIGRAQGLIPFAALGEYRLETSALRHRFETTTRNLAPHAVAARRFGFLASVHEQEPGG